MTKDTEPRSAVPGQGVMRDACLRHDDARRPSALFRALPHVSFSRSAQLVRELL